MYVSNIYYVSYLNPHVVLIDKNFICEWKNKQINEKIKNSMKSKIFLVGGL